MSAAPESIDNESRTPPARRSMLDVRGGPTFLIFVSSGCVMVLEIVAGRLIASHLGSSLYTWTSVIGVVLAGIAVGNHFGGRLADRFDARILLGSLLLASAAFSMGILALNSLVQSFGLFAGLTWPLRIALTVATIFFVPSCLLGTIGPVVVTASLRSLARAGATVGQLYAAGAIGSVAGTFIAGFVLIGRYGTTAIIFGVGATLACLALALVVSSKNQLAAAFLLATGAVAAVSTAQNADGSAGVDGTGYEKYSDHFHIQVVPAKSVAGGEALADEHPGAMALVLDAMVHGLEVPDRPELLIYRYERITAWLTENLIDRDTQSNALFIGGGAYTLPRYLEVTYPLANVDVVEIDPAVTEAAHHGLGLSRTTRIRTSSLDARLYFRTVQRSDGYDFIYGDAFAGFSVPAHLTTLEFTKAIKAALRPGGAYILNIVDSPKTNRFHGAMYNTLKHVFAHVEVYTLAGTYDRQNFVLYASDRRLGHSVAERTPPPELRVVHFSKDQISSLIEQSEGLVLTDDYAPVEQLMSAVYTARRAL